MSDNCFNYNFRAFFQSFISFLRTIFGYTEKNLIFCKATISQNFISNTILLVNKLVQNIRPFHSTPLFFRFLVSIKGAGECQQFYDFSMFSAWQVLQGQAWQCAVGFGLAWRVLARQAWIGSSWRGLARQVSERQARQGWVRHGGARRGNAGMANKKED